MAMGHAHQDLIAAAMGGALAGATKKAIKRRLGTPARKSIMILAALMYVVPLTWGFGLERAKESNPHDQLIRKS